MATRSRDTARGVDALIRSTAKTELVKTSYYLRPDQMEMLGMEVIERKRARRSVNASLLMRAALDLAQRYPDEWDELIARDAS